MNPSGTYPFGSRLRQVVQQDRTPKQVFVLGVYASAVHARWTSADGRVLVRALAVASEPAIFWDGSGAAAIVSTTEAMARTSTHTPLRIGCAISDRGGRHTMELQSRRGQPLGRDVAQASGVDARSRCV